MKHITLYIYQQLQALYPPEEIRSIVRVILTAVSGLSYTQQFSCKDKQIPENEKKQIHAIVDRLKKSEPLQYILGETEFYSLPIKVNPSVLIPRPETEELVDLIIKSPISPPLTSHLSTLNSHLSTLNSQLSPLNSPKFLDIGTGSGCIAIALAKHIPSASVTALDISDEALQTATQNAQLNQVPVRFIQADILDTEKAISLFPENFDLIVSNPPYIKADEKPSLSPNVIDYEPHLALFTPKEAPLLYYNAIADFALKKLSPSGMLFLEINPLCDDLLLEILQNKGFTKIKVTRDLSAKPRFISTNAPLTINHLYSWNPKY